MQDNFSTNIGDITADFKFMICQMWSIRALVGTEYKFCVLASFMAGYLRKVHICILFFSVLIAAKILCKYFDHVVCSGGETNWPGTF